MAQGNPAIAPPPGAGASIQEATAGSPSLVPGVRPVALPAAHAERWAWVDRIRPDAIAIVAILFVTAVVAWHRLWLQNGLAHLDIPTFYLPWYAFMGEHLRALDLPGWNPHVFSGAPFAGDPQSGWMYFPAMLIFPFFESVRAYEIFLIFHLVMAGIATYAYARVIGMRVLASVVAAFAFEFGPLVNHISCCLIHVQLAVWIPVALLAIELLMRSTTWLGRSAAWVLVAFAASQMLAGWVGQGAYNGLIVVGSYLAFRLLFTAVIGLHRWRDRFLRLIVDGSAVLFLGFGMGAAGMLPRLDIVRRTNLAGGEYSGYEVDKYAGGWQLITLLDRTMTDDNGFRSLSFYLGAPVLALLVIAPYLARTRFRVPYFVGLTLFSSFMTLKWTPIHEIFFILLPRFEVLHSHVPNRILAIQWIGPAMLAGATVEMLLRETNRQRVLRAAKIGLVVWGGGTLALLVLLRGVHVWTFVFGLLTCALVAAFAHSRIWVLRDDKAHYRRAQGLLAALLALAVFMDPAGRGLIDTIATGQPSELLELPTGPVARDAVPINASTTDEGGAGEFFQQREAAGDVFRYLGYDYALKEGGLGFPSTYREFYWLPEAQALLVNARAMPLHLNDAQGYNPMQLSRYVNALLFANHEEQNYHDAQFMAEGLDSPILDMLNVRYIVIPNNVAPGRTRPDLQEVLATHEVVFSNELIRVVENTAVLPRAWIVHDVRTADPDYSLMMIDSGLIPIDQLAYLEVDVAALPEMGAPAPDAAENLIVTHDGADQMRLRVSLDAPGLVVVSETYDPGWKAYVDGEEVPLYATNGVIQAVPVPAGNHAIEIVYSPQSLHFGILVSFGFLGISGAIVVAWIWMRLGWFPFRRRTLAAEPA